MMCTFASSHLKTIQINRNEVRDAEDCREREESSEKQTEEQSLKGRSEEQTLKGVLRNETTNFLRLISDKFLRALPRL